MTLIRVLEIAPPDGKFCFGPGNPRTFVERDWFRDDHDSDLVPEEDWPTMETEKGREQITEFIKGKGYFDPCKAYLVLHQTHSFTIGYSAP